MSSKTSDGPSPTELDTNSHKRLTKN